MNGTGKTTTIAKLAARWKNEGKSVILGAADTFRAAAIEQLQMWADRVGVPMIKHKAGSDPGAVAHDTVTAAKARNADVVLIDTAGRLHNKSHLMQELSKVRRVIEKELPGAPHETLLVIDGTTGQNGVNQAAAFLEAGEGHRHGRDEARRNGEGRRDPFDHAAVRHPGEVHRRRRKRRRPDPVRPGRRTSIRCSSRVWGSLAFSPLCFGAARCDRNSVAASALARVSAMAPQSLKAAASCRIKGGSPPKILFGGALAGLSCAVC